MSSFFCPRQTLLRAYFQTLSLFLICLLTVISAGCGNDSSEDQDSKIETISMTGKIMTFSRNSNLTHFEDGSFELAHEISIRVLSPAQFEGQELNVLKIVDKSIQDARLEMPNTVISFEADSDIFDFEILYWPALEQPKVVE